MADGYLNFDTKIDDTGFNTGISRLGSVAKTGLAVLGTAIAGAVAGFGLITKAALDSTAKLEQNLGGVETLFGAHADKVIANSKRAYETAGMSANQYMSTVTSFSASLLQSLEGDTERAVKYADQAIVDMSDNANKMGTSMEAIQYAYQGFAKQNYTMLDNLKLGYGGTKSEMERLIADANKLKKANGEMADLSIDSFADVTEAIHLMQVEMGISGYTVDELQSKIDSMSLTTDEVRKIAEDLGVSYDEVMSRMQEGTLTTKDAQILLGTTAREAATTIEGSMNAAKAAWDNFLNGTISADEFSTAVTTMVVNIVDNLEEIIPRLIETIPAAAKGIYKGISSALDGKALMNDMIAGISETLPAMADAGMQILENLLNGITEHSGGLATKGIEIVTDFAGKIISHLPQLLSAGLQMIMSLAKGIIDNLPVLIEKVPQLINSFFDALWGFIPELIAAGLQLIVQLGVGIIKAIPTIIANAGEIVEAIFNILSAVSLVGVGKNIIKSLGSGISALKGEIKDIIKSIIDDIKNRFTTLNWNGIGQEIINGIARGITQSASAIANAAKKAAKNALNTAKKFLGIHSPSTVFRDEVGKYMAEGIGVGFEQNMPVHDMNDTLKASVNDLANVAAAETTNVPPAAGIIQGQPINNSNIDPEGPNDVYEVHVHTHIDSRELVEETIIITDEELGKRNTRKERGNAG